MSEQRTAPSDREWGTAESVVLVAALLAFATTWGLFVTSPPGGLVSPFGMVISLVAVAYLIFVVFSYLK